MKTNLLVPLCLLFVVLLRFGECWKAPWFCHELECPEYTVVNTYENFEERFYNSSQWITRNIASTSFSDVSSGFMKLYSFIQGDNNEKRVIPLTKPGLVSVTEASENGQRQVSVSFYITPDTVLPKPNDENIREEIRSSGTVFVRAFEEMASESAGIENLEKLRSDLNAAGKLFNNNKYEGAGYDPLLTLSKRHNEVWIEAA